MGLNSFPEGSPSLSDFLSDPTEKRFFDDRFERVLAAWQELYDNEGSTLRGPVRGALDRQAQELSSLGAIPPGAAGGMRSMCAAGYCWRLAEETAEGAEKQDADYRARWTQIMESRPPEFASPVELSRERFLFWGASELVIRSQEEDDASLAWAGCLRGVFTQFDFYSAAIDRTSQVVLPAADIDDAIRHAFVFGLGLRDTERWLDDQEPDGSIGLIVGEAIRKIDRYLENTFDSRASAEASRAMIPAWVGRQSAKAAVAWAAGVMDQEVRNALSAENATEIRTAAEEQARVRYDAELDRVIGDNALHDAVERVHSAVFQVGPPPS
jgi:hypothetical protein